MKTFLIVFGTLCALALASALGQGNDTTKQVSTTQKQEQVSIEKVDALQIELLQTKIESLQKDLQLLAGKLCSDAKFTRESCRVNTVAGIVTGTKIESQKEVAKAPDKK